MCWKSCAREAERRYRPVRRSDPAETGGALEAAGVPVIGTSPDAIDRQKTVNASSMRLTV